MSKPGKDEVIKTLIEFFLDEFEADPMGVGDWLAQSSQDINQFHPAVMRLKHAMSLRD